MSSNRSQAKSAKKAKVEVQTLETSLVIQFTSANGDKLDPSVELPLDTTVKQLETLLNTLLKNEDQVQQTLERQKKKKTEITTSRHLGSSSSL